MPDRLCRSSGRYCLVAFSVRGSSAKTAPVTSWCQAKRPGLSWRDRERPGSVVWSFGQDLLSGSSFTFCRSVSLPVSLRQSALAGEPYSKPYTILARPQRRVRPTALAAPAGPPLQGVANPEIFGQKKGLTDTVKPYCILSGGTEGTRTLGLRRDRPAL